MLIFQNIFTTVNRYKSVVGNSEKKSQFFSNAKYIFKTKKLSVKVYKNLIVVFVQDVYLFFILFQNIRSIHLRTNSYILFSIIKNYD